MAGFRNVVPPLGVYSGAVAPPDGGFDTPVPTLRLSAGVVTLPPDGGFGTPIGALLVRSAGPSTSTGGFGIIPHVRIYAKRGGSPGRHDPGFHKAWFPPRYEARDLEELELIMMAIAAIEDSYEIDGEIEYEFTKGTDS